MATNIKIAPWYFGNTTVRSPFRLRDGLVAISTSALQGHLRGVEQDKAFRKLLGVAGIVELGEDSTNSVGRKWRAALSQLGFLYPEIPNRAEVIQLEIGAVDTITPNGWRLVSAETVAGMQECFLRSLASYYIPNCLEGAYGFSTVFSPLRHTLSIMLELERQTGNCRLAFLEMGLIVQMSNSQHSIESIIDKIIVFRESRDNSTNKRQFDNAERDRCSTLFGYQPRTFDDYADLNFRYLKATGLFQSKGRGITFVPEKHLFIEQLSAETYIPPDNRTYLINLCNGSSLPTDNCVSAKLVLDDLVNQLIVRGEHIDIPTISPTDTASINIARHQVEDRIFLLKEQDYAKQQSAQWQDIAAWMELLIANSNRTITTISGEEIKIPYGEAPAYFEWIVWRAFLAINSLKNPPNKSRKFKIDQDFLPVGTAPGGGPDLIFEFENFVLVVEVTLTTNSRQEAAEGEPVRRHVADSVLAYSEFNKKVYGLFIANKIDSNTAETFRFGVWYLKDDNRMLLDIVPMPLSHFKTFFVAMFQNQQVDTTYVEEILLNCRNLREHDAPIWKAKICEEVSAYSTMLSARTCV